MNEWMNAKLQKMSRKEIVKEMKKISINYFVYTEEYLKTFKKKD